MSGLPDGTPHVPTAYRKNLDGIIIALVVCLRNVAKQ
jgi:hypothetical protein